MIIREQDNTAMIDLNFSVALNGPNGELAVIRARGADAGSFLQGQLTQDVLLMKPTEARLAAWCSAKGRMLASFVVCKLAQDEFLLILSRDVLATTLKRMKMFVLRAKCELTDATAEMAVEGLLGQAAQDAPNAMNLVAPRADWMPAGVQNDSQMLVGLPPGYVSAGPVARALLIRFNQAAPAAEAERVAAWNALEISSGIARLSAAVSEAFVPQMLNYESVGGVNFKKGCYPGQEVVARSQFRGTLKRRAYIVTCSAALQTGQEVFDAREPDQPCGQVAQAAAHPAGGFVAIVSMQISASDSPTLHVGAPDGALLQMQALPYALLADV
jgi:folate-binding protein YgfZ